MPGATHIRIRRLANAVLIAGAATMLAVPGLRLSSHEFNAAQENRNPAPWPGWHHAWAGWPAAAEAYFNDHFGMRRALLGLRNQLLLRMFHVSATPDVLVGRDDWLFYAGDRSVEDFQGRAALDPASLMRWVQALRDRHAQLAARGVRYYFLIAPNKQSIYPDRMPAGLVRGATDNFDRLLSALAAAPGGVPDWVIDVRPALLASRGAIPLYHRVDVHWNLAGAYTAYRQLAGRLRQDGVALAEFSAAATDFVPQRTRQGDLARMLGVGRYPAAVLTAGYAGRPIPCVAMRPAPADGLSPFGTSGLDRVSTCAAAPAGSGAMLFGDSMSGALAVFLSPSFARLRWVLAYPDIAAARVYADAEKPAVMIEERVERQLITPPPGPAPDLLPQPPPALTATCGLVRVVTTPDHARLALEGWAPWRTGAAGARMFFETNLPVRDTVLAAHDRPDVAADQHDAALLASGFLGWLMLDPARPWPARPRLCLWVRDPVYGQHQLGLLGQPGWDQCPGPMPAPAR